MTYIVTVLGRTLSATSALQVASLAACLLCLPCSLSGSGPCGKGFDVGSGSGCDQQEGFGSGGGSGYNDGDNRVPGMMWEDMLAPVARQARYASTRAFDACVDCAGAGASGAGSDSDGSSGDMQQDGYESNAGARGAGNATAPSKGGDGDSVVSAMPRHVAVALASQADVPPRVQRGPTCGLYALGMVLDYWALRCSGRRIICCASSRNDPSRPATLPVVEGDLTRADAVSAATLRAAMAASADRCDNCELLRIARGLGVTTAGELFSASYVADVARAAGYSAAVVRPLTPQSIAWYTTRGVPLLIAFDVDADGHPARRGGHTAHWSVVQAVYVHPHWGTPRAVVTHAWTGDEYDWDLSSLLESNAQLRRTDYGPAQHLDLQRTLAHQAVAVWPRCCCAARA